VEEKRITELYWCGGEPLMWKTHWNSMSRIVELGYADQVLARYNSNISRIRLSMAKIYSKISYSILKIFKYVRPLMVPEK
jgi:hypothetical protein